MLFVTGNVLAVLQEICERFLFVKGGSVTEHADFEGLMGQADVRQYLGALAR
ncbi:MAG: hypothetical protein Q8M24_16605 [Pseudolabrys sp.]|nr:hypothetical protein [Pseudolabrys sp.]